MRDCVLDGRDREGQKSLAMFVHLKLLCTAALWGGTFVAGRVVSAHLGPFSAAFLRFLLASACLAWLTMRLEGRLPRLSRRGLLGVTGLGLTGVFAYNALFFLGLQTVQAGRASVIVACNPVAIALGAILFFGERLTPLRMAGIALSVCGAWLVVSRGHPLSVFSGSVTPGDVAIMGCVLAWSSYVLLGKRVMGTLSPLGAVTWSCIVGGALLLPPALAEGLVSGVAVATPGVWSAVGYLGVFGTVLGFTWFYQGVHRIGAAKAGVYINFVPVSAIVLGWLLLGETMDSSLWLGAALVLSGVWLTNRPARVRPPGDGKAPGG